MNSKVKLEKVIRHKDLVLDNAKIIAEHLMDEGGEENELTARMLIAWAYDHDRSKLYSLEWDHLVNYDPKDPKLKEAINHHLGENPHHPEYWKESVDDPIDISEMPEQFIAEMVCDWKARATEFGTCLVEWIDEKATVKYNFVKGDAVYARIMRYVNMICEKAFTD